MKTKVELYNYSKKKYDALIKKGVKVRLMYRGENAEIVAYGRGENGDKIIVEVEHIYNGKIVNHANYFNEKSDKELQMFVGVDDLEIGDIIIESHNQNEGSFFFIGKLTGFSEKGFVFTWEMDCECGQFNAGSLLYNPNNNDMFVRKATEEEIKMYYNGLKKNGYIYDEENRCLVPYPRIGERYWTVEINKDGFAEVVAHEPAATEEERPNRFNIFRDRNNAVGIAEEINKRFKRRW